MMKLSTIIIFFSVISSTISGQEPTRVLSDPILTFEIELNISQEEAFGYFLDSDQLEKWLCMKAEVDQVVGGKYELFWSPGDPDLSNNSTFGCRIIALNRPYYFVTEWRGNKDHKSFMNNVRPLTQVMVYFDAVDKERTKVTLIHSGWRRGKSWDKARQYFGNAWGKALSNLETLINGSQ